MNKEIVIKIKKKGNFLQDDIIDYTEISIKPVKLLPLQNLHVKVKNPTAFNFEMFNTKVDK